MARYEALRPGQKQASSHILILARIIADEDPAFSNHLKTLAFKNDHCRLTNEDIELLYEALEEVSPLAHTDEDGGNWIETYTAASNTKAQPRIIQPKPTNVEPKTSISVMSEETFNQALELVQEGPVTYSDHYRTLKIDSDETLIELLIKAGARGYIAVVSR